MLARLQKAVAIGLAVFAVVWAVVAVWAGHSALWMVGAAIPAALYITTIAAEFYVLRRSFGSDDPQWPTAVHLARAFAREIRATPRIFLWWQPFRSLAEPDSLASGSNRQQTGLVLLHGFLCNRGLWTLWMRRLRGMGVPYIAVDLEPVFGTIDDYIATIDRAVDSITAATGHCPVVVAHSMGGLAARAWLARVNGESPCSVLVTIGTPHRGTWTARHSSARNGREMRIGSAWLDRLARSESARPHRRAICFWSHCDNIVFPSMNATLPDADNRHLEATPHVQMIHHPEVFAAVLQLLEERPRKAPSPRA